MSSFEEDPELEEKLSVDPRELDEEDLQDVQVYKSQKLKALRDEGQSGDHPDWWTGDHAPETMDELAGAIGEDGAVPGGSGEEDEAEEEPEAEEEEAEEADESAEESEEEAAEEEETQEESAEEPATESTETTETPESPSSVTSEGVPQVGWSQGVPQTDEIDFDNELIQGLYQRQDQLMETLQAVNQGMSEVEVGGDAIESIRNSLDELNEKVDALAEGDLLTKVEEVHEFLATARNMETKLAELPPLPSEEELIEAGILDKAIEHEGSDNCFTTSVDNRKAALHYGLNQDRLTAFHFSLPSILSESVRNVVEDVLARALFEHAKEEGKTVHPQAPRLRSGFLARHPEYYELTPESVQERHR